MGWLRWMEELKRADAWLNAEKWEDKEIPNLLRATDALRKARKK
jgi:hypothetical protein